MSKLLRWITLACAAVVALTALPAERADAWTAQTVRNLSDGEGFGVPAGVVRRNGALYGVVSDGGCGYVFKLTEAGPDLPWERLIIHDFQGGVDDGCRPFGELVFDADGALYGTTRNGGREQCSADGNSCGIVFKLTPRPAPEPWTFRIIHKFRGAAQGFYPVAGVVFGTDGALYGTTGGYCGHGGSLVYRLAPVAGPGQWEFSILRRFTSIASPVAFGPDGALYGTDWACQNGIVFRLKPPATPGGAWSYRLLHTFTGGTGGSAPYGGVTFGPNGSLFGTTSSGGGPSGAGTIYRLLPQDTGPYKHAVIHRFNGNNGYQPWGELIRRADGSLYGTTHSGGSAEFGTVFKLAPPPDGETIWPKTVLWTFPLSGPQGYRPLSPLTPDGANGFFGTNFYSDVFRLVP